MNAKQIIKILNLTAAHSLYREDGLWYHHLKKFPGILFDSTGYILIGTEEAYQANPHLQHAKDLHVTNGISNIPGYIYFSDEQKFKLALIDADDAKDNESIIRKKRLIYVFLRNKVIVGKVKNLYSNRCQICGLQLKIKENQYYSEVHHIVPLGNPHNGLDNMKNMLCVCPNCHVLLDLGAIKIVITEIRVNHQINPVFVSYHNEIICKAV